MIQTTNTKTAEAQRVVAALEAEELSRFREWFEAMAEERWDDQLAADAAAGKLDALAAAALASAARGENTPL